MLVGIVGKPNCGKSTFFKAATLAEALIANYPFATIKPNEGIGYVKIDVPDKMTPESIMELTAKIIQMVGSGEMPASQGERLMGMISVHLAAIETQILESDIRDLKTQHGAIISDHKARVYRINDLATARKALGRGGDE